MKPATDKARISREAYSPLRYPGGKAKLSAFLAEVMRYNGYHQPHYVEPYAGGAGAALRLLCEEFVECVTINDADPRIRCFWQAVTQHTDRFVELVYCTPLTVKEWRRQREVYEKRDLRKVFELGFATFYLNRTTRSGIVHNGGPIGGYDQSGNYKIDARFNRLELVRRIERIGAYADRIAVTGADGLSLLRGIGRDRARAQQSFVYLDPPYYAKGAELYLNRFTPAEHSALADYLCPPRRFPWVMTYDDVAEIRRLYGNLHYVSFHLSYSAYERRKGRELLIYPTSIEVPPRAMQLMPALVA